MQDFYGQCSDEELILHLRDGDENIIDYIMEKYKDMRSETDYNQLRPD